MNDGRVFVFLLILTGLIGSLAGGGLVYSRLLASGAMLTALSWLWARLSLRWIHIEREARSLRASVGDRFDERFELVNAGRLPCLWVEIVNESTLPAAAGSQVLTLIGRRQRRMYIARTWLTRRGRFPLGPTTLRSGDPFGLFYASQRSLARDHLVVLPMISEIKSFLSPPGLLPGGRVIRRKALGVTPHAAGVREYVPGDPLKSIHWPTTARRGQLMVKEFEQDPQAEVWLFLDAQAGVHAKLPYQPPQVDLTGALFARRPRIELPPSSLEYAVSIAASLAHFFIRQKRAVGLATAAQIITVIMAERSERQEMKILETLAFVEDLGSLPLAGLVAAQAGQLPQGSSVILITPSVRAETLVAAEDLQRRNLRPVVILLLADTFGGPRGGAELHRSLLERGVPVCLIACGADLSETLSNFTAESMYRDFSVWQRPPLTYLT